MADAWTSQVYVPMMRAEVAVTTLIYVLAVYCLLFKSPTHLKPYSRLLFNHVFWCILQEWVTSGMTPVLCVPAIGFCSAGFLTSLVPAEIQFVLVTMILQLNAASIMHLFWYRLKVVIPPSYRYTHEAKRLGALGICIFYSLQGFVAPSEYFFMLEDQEWAQRRIAERMGLQQVCPMDANCVVNTGESTGFIAFIGLATAGGSAFVISCTAVVLITVGVLQHQKHYLSPYSLKLHRTFLGTLAVQMGVHVAMLLTPVLVLFFSALLSKTNAVLSHLCIFVLTIHGATSTLLMLLINAPFRRALRSGFRRSDGATSMSVSTKAFDGPPNPRGKRISHSTQLEQPG